MKQVKTRFKTVRRRAIGHFRAWRKYRGMTLQQVAEASGMSTGNVGHIETGEQGYTQDALEALAKVYKISPGWLLDVNPYDDTIFPADGSTPDQIAKLQAMAKSLKTG